MFELIKPYRKAVVAALIAGFTALGVALGDDVISRAEWIGAVIAALSALGITYMVPNRPKDS